MRDVVYSITLLFLLTKFVLIRLLATILWKIRKILSIILQITLLSHNADMTISTNP
jgi:hypothetical protein